MIDVTERQDDVIIMRVTGRLTRDDYSHLLPQFEEMVSAHGKVRALIELDGFKGWTPKAFVDELRFDVKHRNDVRRCAIVGDRKVEKLGTKLATSLFSGNIRYFPKEQWATARRWLEGN